MTPIEIKDQDKLDAVDVVRDILKRAAESGTVVIRPTVCHVGILYGQVRQQLHSHAVSREEIVRVATAWAQGGDGARANGVRHIGDNEIHALVAQVDRVPVADWGGLFDLGCQFGQRVEAGMSLPRAYYETGAWVVYWYGGDNPWPSTIGSHPDPVNGQVSIQDGAWCVGGTPRNIAGLHLGNVIGNAMTHGLASVIPTLDLAQEIGAHEARMWFQLHTLPRGWWDQWSTPRWNPADDRVLFAETLAAVAERGIKMHLAGGGIKDMSDGEENAAFGTLNWAIGQVGPEAFSVIEACNEIRDTGDEDDIDPKELTRLVRLATEGYPQILTALSAYTGTEDKDILRRYTPSWMRFYIVHGERGGHMHDKLRHMYSLAHDGEGEPVRRNMKQSESYGPGRLVSATSNSHEINAHTMTLSAAMCAIARGQWTFMSGPGVVLETEPLADMAGLRETPEILRRLPQDLAQFQTLGHGGDSKRGQRIYAALDDWRYDYAINNDGRYVGIAYGPPEQHSPDDLRKERITFDDEVLADGPYGRVTTGRLN